MDINICIDKLGLNANTYRLSQNVAPHEIIDWDSGNPDTQPTATELENAWAEYQAEQGSTQYQRQRATAYPSMQEQADMQYWDSVNGTTTWQDAIALVKATYPKGGS
jgi:hypothetical protein